jgi:hypothetical protein
LDEGVYPFGDSTWIIADTHFFHANIGQYCFYWEHASGLHLIFYDRHGQDKTFVGVMEPQTLRERLMALAGAQ